MEDNLKGDDEVTMEFKKPFENFKYNQKRKSEGKVTQIY